MVHLAPLPLAMHGYFQMDLLGLGNVYRTTMLNFVRTSSNWRLNDMPKFIGNTIEGTTPIQDNAQDGIGRVRLTYAQATRLPASVVMHSLDTTDSGSRGTYAKRWYRWFATAADIVRMATSTPNMRYRALVNFFLHSTDTCHKVKR